MLEYHVTACCQYSPTLWHGNLKAVALFAGIGLFFPGTVALLNFESNRLMGPNIAGALSSMAPVFAILLAIAILGEHIRGPQLLALAAIVIGIALMYRGQVSLSGRSPWLLALPVAASAIRGVIQPIVKFGVGLCNGLSVLATYGALEYAPVAIISPLIASYPLVTLLLSRAFLRKEDLRPQLIAGVTATVCGVILLFVA